MKFFAGLLSRGLTIEAGLTIKYLRYVVKFVLDCELCSKVLKNFVVLLLVAWNQVNPTVFINDLVLRLTHGGVRFTQIIVELIKAPSMLKKFA